MAILIRPPAKERMAERGATDEEVAFTIRRGFPLPARFGRRKHRATMPFERFRGDKFYRFKQIEVYSVGEEEDVMVVTVVVKHF